MARLKRNNINGPFIGKVGNLVGCKWKDTYYVRIRPAKVKHPNSEAQMAQRMRFAITQQFIQPLKGFLKIGFGAYTSDKSAYNAAMSYNMKNALEGTYPEIIVNPEKALFSKGKLGVVEDAIVKINEQNNLEFSWNNNAETSNISSNDKAIIILKSLSDLYSYYKLDAAKRSDKIALMPIREEHYGKTFACYLVFVDQDVLLSKFSENAISNSIYCGNITIEEK